MKLVQEMSDQLKQLTEKVRVLEEKIGNTNSGSVAVTLTVTNLPPFVSKEDLIIRVSVENEKAMDLIAKVLEILKGKGLKLARKEDFGLYVQLANKRAEIDSQEIIAKAIKNDERDSLVIVYKKK
jgi:hypothetical protein